MEAAVIYLKEVRYDTIRRRIRSRLGSRYRH